MKPLPHLYEVQLQGESSGYAKLRADGPPEMRVAAPADFDGPGDAWSPEHLLLAAVESCLLLTLRSIASASKVDFAKLEVASQGTVDRKDGVMRFTEIVLRPRLTVPPGTDVERARRILEKSEKACLISASLSTPVRLEPEIVTAG